MTDLETLKQEIKKTKPVYGLDVTLKKLRNGQAKKIYLANNCKDKETVKRYAAQQHIEIVELTENNIEVGIICKRSHPVSILCFS